MAKLTISASDLQTFTSSVTTTGVVVEDGWNRHVNNEGDRLTGCAAYDDYNINWRTFVQIPWDKLTVVADKKVNSVKLIVQPKANNACSIACTQAILTNKTLSVLENAGINLLDNTWCTQGYINGSRYGDIGLSATGTRNFQHYTTSRPYTRPSGDTQPTIVTTSWSAGKTIPLMQYIFDNVEDIDFRSNVGFYIIRYKPNDWTSGMGKSGWLYTTEDSWTVEIDYEPSYNVTVNVEVNGNEAGNNFMLALSKTDGIAIGINNGSTITPIKFPNKNHVAISVPAGSQITLVEQFLTAKDQWLRVSTSSGFNTESNIPVNSAISIDVSFDLKVEMAFLSNTKGPDLDISSSLNLFYDQFEKFYGDVIYLPINPGIKYDDRDAPIPNRSPDMFFSGAEYWDYINREPIHVENEPGNSMVIPDLYDDVDFEPGKKYVADCLCTGETIARKYTLNNELEIKLGKALIPWNKDQEQSEYIVPYSANSDPLAEMKSKNAEKFTEAKLSYLIDDTEVVGWNTILDEVYNNNKGKLKDELSYEVKVKTYIEPSIKLVYKNNSEITECLPYEQTQANVGIPLFPVLI